MRLLSWVATSLAVLLPVAGLVMAIILSCLWGFSWVNFGVMLGMYVVTALGITVGFHRLFTHRSFETFNRVKFLFAVLGSMAVEGSLMRWVAFHRRHHQHSDTPDDPHSPHHHGRGLLGLLRGAWHAHIGWFFEPDPVNMDNYVKDLKKIPGLRVADALWPLWVVLGLAIPSAIGLACGGWRGCIGGFLWGGLVRVFLGHHVTWCVNSVCHIWGRKPYPAGDESRNNAIVGILALGEGWHNNHHAFPSSARHGLQWWQIDVSYWLIRAMEACGLAWKVRVPSAEELAMRCESSQAAQ